MLEQQQAVSSSTNTTNFLVCYCWILLVFIYSFQYQENGSTLVDTKKGLSRRSIDQLGYIKDINSLVSLSGTINNITISAKYRELNMSIPRNYTNSVSPPELYSSNTTYKSQGCIVIRCSLFRAKPRPK